jgi:hypothetical protein
MLPLALTPRRLLLLLLLLLLEASLLRPSAVVLRASTKGCQNPGMLAHWRSSCTALFRGSSNSGEILFITGVQRRNNITFEYASSACGPGLKACPLLLLAAELLLIAAFCVAPW